MADGSPAEASQQQAVPSPVVYVLLRPAKSSTLVASLVVLGVGGVLAMLSVSMGGVALTLGLVFLAIGVVWGAIAFIGRGINLGYLQRAFAAYWRAMRGLRPGDRPPASLVRRGRDVDPDLLGAVIFYSRLPKCGDYVLEPSSAERPWREFVERVTWLGMTVPRTVADQQLRATLASIPLTADLLEPEFVRQQSVQRPGLLVIPLTIIIWIAMRHMTVIAAIALICGAFAVISAVLARFRISFFSSDDATSLVVGCGAIKSPAGMRWTVHDSHMILQRYGSWLAVSVYGPPGRLQLMFRNAKDPDFINLWQRWNHLAPKPELLE